MSNSLHDFIRGLPKAELHLHIEGSLEPEMMFELARKNGVSLPYASVEEVRAAYDFEDLQSFLNLYYAGAAVLQTEQDFFDLTHAYIQRARADHVCHVELFFDPQTHTERGIAIATVFAGIARALREAKAADGFSGSMILCFLRHLSEESALATLEAALPLREAYADVWTGVGLIRPKSVIRRKNSPMCLRSPRRWVSGWSPMPVKKARQLTSTARWMCWKSNVSTTAYEQKKIRR
jgi:adenosine deaminase